MARCVPGRLLGMVHGGWKCALLCLFLAWSGTANAGPPLVTVFLSEDGPAYRETADHVRLALEQSALRPHVRTVSRGVGKIDLSRERPDLIVAVGALAGQELAAQNLSIPVLVTLIPRQAFERIARQRDHRLFSAVYLDQPLSRQMDLIHLALPGRNRVGVVLGPESQNVLKTLQNAAREARFVLVPEKIQQGEELLPALQRVLAESDVLLAVPDSLLFSKGTVQSVLLTTYRYQDPVIGFSQAYVRAGALAAVYSTPEQAGRQAGELVLRTLTAKTGQLPPPEYPKYFSVSVNGQVARSLGINIADEGALLERLKQGVEQE